MAEQIGVSIGSLLESWVLIPPTGGIAEPSVYTSYDYVGNNSRKIHHGSTDI